jgi:hypothetical protein
MTEEKRDRPTLPARRVPRPAPDLGRDPIDVPQPSAPEPTPSSRPSSRVRSPAAVPKREVTVQLGTRVNERTKDLLDYLKTAQRQDIRVSIEVAVEEKYGHLLPRDD